MKPMADTKKCRNGRHVSQRPRIREVGGARSVSERRGAALVEAALVLPLFFVVVLGIIEFGRAMMVSQVVTNATREAVRQAILDGSTNQAVEQWIKDFLGQTLNVAAGDVSVKITVTPAPGNPNPNNQLANAQNKDLVTINVSVPFDKVSLIPGHYLAGKNLWAEVSMRHE